MHKIYICLMVTILATLSAFASVESEYQGIQGSMSLYAMKQNNGYKLYDNSNAKFISEEIYDMIYGCYAYSNNENKVVVVRSGNRFGLIDSDNGKEVLSPTNSPITNFADSIYAPKPLIWNIDGKKETLTSVPIYTDARWGYHSDLNPVIYYYGRNSKTYLLSTSRMGFCDKEGNEVIAPLFDGAGSFIKGVAIVMNNNKMGAINTSGELILPFEYDEILYDNDFLKIYKSEDYYKRRLAGTLGTSRGFDSPKIMLYSRLEGIADSCGKIIVPCKYANVNYFSKTYQSISSDYTNKEVVKFMVREKISNGGYLWGLIDTNGHEILPVKYADISDGGFGRYILMDSLKHMGMADNKGNIIIPMKYTAIYPSLKSEYIIIKQNDKAGIITPSNNILIKPNKFDNIYLEQAHSKISFFAVLNGKCGRIDSKGKILLALKYDTICAYREKDDDSMIVEVDGQCMRINSKGGIIERYKMHPYTIEEEEIILPIIRFF